MKRMALWLGLLLLPGIVHAQEVKKEDQEARLRALEERVKQLETMLETLRAAQSAAPAPVPPAAEPAGLPPAAAQPAAGTGSGGTIGGSAANAKALNPDISVIGNFLGAVGHNTVQPRPSLEMKETEISFSAIIDPYARGDFFVTITPEGVDLEEGYITFTSLPGGLVARAGKMRAAFGKANLMHSHTMPWTDRPLVTESLLAGEDGINDAGVSVSRILPAPKGIFLEATAQAFKGDSGDVFTASRKQDVAFAGHLRGYADLNEATNLDLGFSYARGHNDTGVNALTQLYGLDATLRWKPLRRSIYQSFLARSEFVWSRREQSPALQRAFGFYTSAEYRVNRRWTVGGRFDLSDRARDAAQRDKGFSALLTYWPSEFSQIRGQYRWASYAEGVNANELRFQFLFVLGAHGAHPF